MRQIANYFGVQLCVSTINCSTFVHTLNILSHKPVWMRLNIPCSDDFNTTAMFRWNNHD